MWGVNTAPHIYSINLLEVINMQHIEQNHLYQKQQNITLNNKWSRRVYATGFLFFFIKGLAWIAAVVWVVY
jgi:hypothetical protein